MRPPFLLPALAILLLVGMTGCGSADFWYFETNNLSGGPTILIVCWSDSAVDRAERVVVTLERLELVGPEGTEILLEERRSFDLLTLRNGRFAELAHASVPAGRYTGFRFHLAPDRAGHHAVRVGGVDHALRFPAAGAGVIDLAHALDLPEDGEQTVHVDFNVRLSVTEAGGVWWLQPHLRALDPAGAGALIGELRGSTGGPLAGATVSAQQAGMELLSTQTRFDGTFHLGPLPAGRYSLVATAPDHAPASEGDVTVFAGGEGGPYFLFLEAAEPGGVLGTAPAGRPGLVIHVIGAAGLVAIAGVDPLSGSFHVPVLAPGAYTFELRDARAPVEVRSGVLVTAGGTTNVSF